MPVEFCPFAPIIVCHQLDEKGEVLCEENTVPESKCPSVVFPGEVIVAGKTGWHLELAEKFSMQGEFVVREKRIFLLIRAVQEYFISPCFTGGNTKKPDKQEHEHMLFFKIHKLILSGRPGEIVSRSHNEADIPGQSIHSLRWPNFG